jgi:hypothetical protein
VGGKLKRFMPRLDIERQKKLEPSRLNSTKELIQDMGYTITKETKTELQFKFRGETVHFFPYSGWHSGKSIRDGRGFSKLLKQIMPKP